MQVSEVPEGVVLLPKNEQFDSIESPQIEGGMYKRIILSRNQIYGASKKSFPAEQTTPKEVTTLSLPIALPPWARVEGFNEELGTTLSALYPSVRAFLMVNVKGSLFEEAEKDPEEGKTTGDRQYLDKQVMREEKFTKGAMGVYDLEDEVKAEVKIKLRAKSESGTVNEFKDDCDPAGDIEMSPENEAERPENEAGDSTKAQRDLQEEANSQSVSAKTNGLITEDKCDCPVEAQSQVISEKDVSPTADAKRMEVLAAISPADVNPIGLESDPAYWGY